MDQRNPHGLSPREQMATPIDAAFSVLADTHHNIWQSARFDYRFRATTRNYELRPSYGLLPDVLHQASLEYANATLRARLHEFPKVNNLDEVWFHFKGLEPQNCKLLVELQEHTAFSDKEDSCEVIYGKKTYVHAWV
jgi:hypothetical protein